MKGFLLFMGIYCCIKGSYSGALDVVIVADSSDYVGALDWGLEQTVMLNALSALEIGPCNVRILGLIRYANKSDTISPLGDIGSVNNDNVDYIVDSIKLLGGNYADLEGALRAAANLFKNGCYNRPNVPNLVIVVTSSSNSTVEEVKSATTELEEIGDTYVSTYGMEVGNRIKPSHINAMARESKFQLNYNEYNDAVTLFKTLMEITPRECGYTRCAQCPSNTKEVDLTYTESNFFTMVKKTKGMTTDKSYLKESGGFVTLMEDQHIIICRVGPGKKVVNNRVKQQDIEYFRFYKLCLETKNVETISIAKARGKGNPFDEKHIEPELTEDWTETCFTSSTYYSWKKIRIMFTPADNKNTYGVRNLHMVGCVNK